MTKIVEYECDLCKKCYAFGNDVFGLHFFGEVNECGQNLSLTLREKTDDHICLPCARSIYYCMEKDEPSDRSTTISGPTVRGEVTDDPLDC